MSIGLKLSNVNVGVMKLEPLSGIQPLAGNLGRLRHELDALFTRPHRPADKPFQTQPLAGVVKIEPLAGVIKVERLSAVKRPLAVIRPPARTTMSSPLPL